MHDKELQKTWRTKKQLFKEGFEGVQKVKLEGFMNA